MNGQFPGARGPGPGTAARPAPALSTNCLNAVFITGRLQVVSWTLASCQLSNIIAAMTV